MGIDAQRSEARELRKLLIDADMNQNEVAQRMGLHYTAISQYLNAHRRWPQDFPAKFREAVSR